MNIHGALTLCPIVAIIRDRDGRSDLAEVIDSLANGGIRAIEITVDTPGWAEAVAARAERSDIALGAGTVRRAEELDTLVAVGGSFAVSPHTDRGLIQATCARGLASMPGAFTPTEIQTAVDAGADFVKLFPAAAVGPPYLRALTGPFRGVRFIPTGGVSPEAASSWLEAGASAVGLGGSLVHGSAGEIVIRAQEAASAVPPPGKRSSP